MTFRLLALVALSAPLLAPSTASAQAVDDDVPPTPQRTPPPVEPAPLDVALSGPEEMAYDAERGVPTGYTAVERRRMGLLIGGGITFAVGYSAALRVAAPELAADRDEWAPLAIPIAGPFILLAQTDGDDSLLRMLLVGVGALQTTGAILLIVGLTTKKTVYVRNDLVGSMTVTPYTGDGTTGMMLSGRF